MKRTGNNKIFEDINSILLNSIRNEVCFFHKTLSEWACMRVCACAWVCMRVWTCVCVCVWTCVGVSLNFGRFPKIYGLFMKALNLIKSEWHVTFKIEFVFSKKPNPSKNSIFPPFFGAKCPFFFIASSGKFQNLLPRKWSPLKNRVSRKYLWSLAHLGYWRLLDRHRYRIRKLLEAIILLRLKCSVWLRG